MRLYSQTATAPSSTMNDGGTWASPSAAATNDGSPSTEVLSALGTHGTALLFQVWTGFSIPSNATIRGIKVEGFLWTTPLDQVAVLDIGQVQISNDSGSTFSPATGPAGTQPVGLTPAWYGFGGTNDLWGRTWDPNDFNQFPHPIPIPSPLQVTFNPQWKSAGSDGDLEMDGIRMTVWYTLPSLSDNDMDNYYAAKEAGWKVLGSESVTISNSASQLFPNAPAGTRMARITIRTSDITVRGDGTPTASVNGIDYYAGGPYDFPFNDSELAGFKAIRTGGSDAVVWVEYWGLP